MTNDPTFRVPAGVPTGGQFAASAKAESGVALAERATFFPPATLTPREVEHLIENKGTFADGYDEDKINNVFGQFTSARFVCVWDRYDDYGYGGNSDFAGVAMGSRASGAYGAGRAVPDPKGSWRSMHPQVWEYLSDPDSDIDPETIPSLLADEVFDSYDNLDDMAGDGFHNLAAEAVFDKETCAAEDCDDDLTDNEGYDGYCGHHAELIEAHEAGEHETHIASDSGSNDDCPECD